MSAFIFSLDSRAFFENAMSGFFLGVFSSDVLLRPLKASSAMPGIEFFRRQNMRTVGGVLFQRESISIRPTEKRFVSTYGFTKLRQRRVKPGTCYRQGNVLGACMTLRGCKRRGLGELAAVASSVRSAVRKLIHHLSIDSLEMGKLILSVFRYRLFQIQDNPLR